MAKKTEKPSAPLLGGSGGLKKLAPPPGSKKLAPPGGMMSTGAPASFNSGVPQQTSENPLNGLDFGISQQAPINKPSSDNFGDLFGDFASGNTNNVK